jgi:hypothetical protein
MQFCAGDGMTRKMLCSLSSGVRTCDVEAPASCVPFARLGETQVTLSLSRADLLRIRNPPRVSKPGTDAGVVATGSSRTC